MIVSAVFAVATWLRGRSSGSALRVWSFALLQFGIAAGALWWGALFGWTSALYRVFYVFGAVLNVAWLGLGTLRLFMDKWASWFATCLLVAASSYAVYRIAGTAFIGGAGHALRTETLPPPRAVMPGSIRDLSRWFSIGGSVVVLGGLIWSIVKRRHTLGLALLALGVAVVGVTSELARAGHVVYFPIGLAVGIVVMYAGFLRTT
jgi:hypothetical protein